MSRYIDADALKEWLDEYLSVFKKYDKSEVKGFVEHQPSIDIEPKRGEWIDFKNGWKCSACGKWNNETSNFCPNCGARMKGEEPSIDIQQWIPCVEEMPEEFVYVLICLKDGSMYVAQLTDYIDIWGNPKWCTNTKHCLGGAILGSEAIAWKPLPEPYGEREGE